MRTRIGFLTTMAFLICGSGASVSAAIIHVPTDHPDIASALAAAVAGDQVVVAAGTYPEHDLILRSGVVLRGATGNPADVVIDGTRSGRCVYGAGLDAATRLEALTLTNGLPGAGSAPDESAGGGLFVDGGALTVANCVFSRNETAVGGGAFVKGTGTPAFVGCVFDGNEATESAGLFLRGVCNPIVQDCVFRNGVRTLLGGGLTWAGSGQALIERCTVEDNTVYESGGGVEVIGTRAVAVLRDCLIRRNAAAYDAGGLYVGNYGSAILERCEITGNSAAGAGGGILLGTGAVLTAIECTILDNAAPVGPDGSIGPSASATLTCCVFAPDAWQTLGSLIVNNDDCAVAVETTGWGELKAMFRP